MVKAARQERAKERRVVVTNRELWIDGRRWRWDEVKQCWQVGRGRWNWSRKRIKEVVLLVENGGREMREEADRNRNMRGWRRNVWRVEVEWVGEKMEGV